MKRLLNVGTALIGLVLVSCARMQTAPVQAVWFVEPKDGATVTSPFKVVFGVKGMAVEPTGEIKPELMAVISISWHSRLTQEHWKIERMSVNDPLRSSGLLRTGPSTG